MTTSAERMRAWSGPAILGAGFRPLFLAAGIWGVVAMLLWILTLTGAVRLPIAFDPVSWHVHALLWGYLGAAVAGFLLTAVPNWTGRLPVVGWPLLGLVALWLAGRLAVLFGGALDPALVAAADLSFLAVLAALVAREILAGRNLKNIPVLALLVLLLSGNAVFHWEAAQGAYAAAGVGMRLGTAAAILMISFVGGRVTPSFTRNWLVKRDSDRLPAPFGALDRATLAVTAAALASWVVMPQDEATGWACLAAGALGLVRLARWEGMSTFAEPLVTVLHVGVLFVPLGFVLLGGSILAPEAVPRVAALHAWLAGGIGVMTLAVMTRASLGHTGRDLTAGAATVAIYVLVVAAVLLRIVAAFMPASVLLLHGSAALWIGAFALFAAIYGPLLASPRR